MPSLEGKKAPAVKLPASDGTTVDLKNFAGKKNIVLYFYPKDDTPGCTVEACNFRDRSEDILKENAVVFGVSPDSVAKHKKFIEKYKLPFLLLSDEEKNVLQKFGVWVEKSMYGRTYMGVQRSTFIIDKTGRVAKQFDNVKPKDHHTEVLAALKNLS